MSERPLPVLGVRPAHVAERALVVVDLDRPHLVPLHDIYAHLIYAVGRDDVRTTVIRGRVVMRYRELTTIDERETMVEVAELAARLRRDEDA